MTAKEKAEELVEKFEYNGVMIDDVRMNEEDAKQCALICVDEIIKATQRETINDSGTGIDVIPMKYWQEVKQEVNKL
jgi:hypothetical protein|tara:strand:+ start:903 stop:1133 length:231 start_codon:yes stop_codon:yes gene_type:complete